MHDALGYTGGLQDQAPVCAGSSCLGFKTSTAFRLKFGGAGLPGPEATNLYPNPSLTRLRPCL